jgi:alpha-galactosidase
VLHPHDSLQRIRYSLAATFLGRMCVSGRIAELPPESWQLACEMIALYQQAAPVIKYGRSRRFGEMGESWRYPQGWQAVVRTSEDRALVVLHTFAEAPGEVVVALDGDGWVVRESMGVGEVRILGKDMVVERVGDFCGGVWLLGR